MTNAYRNLKLESTSYRSFRLIARAMAEGEVAYPDIQEKIRSAKIRNPDERYIVITAVYVQPSSIIEVSACSFDSEGKGEDLPPFQVKYTSKD